MMNAKRSVHRFGPCHENEVIRTNDTPQLISEFQVGFPLLWIRINQNKPKSIVMGSQLETHIQVVGYRLNRLDVPFGQNLCCLSLACIIDWRNVSYFVQSYLLLNEK